MLIRLPSVVAALVLGLSSGMNPTVASADSEDLFKAVAGLTAIAIIASEVKKKNEAKRAPVIKSNLLPAARQRPPAVCNRPYQDGNVWRNSDGRVCLPTPRVCLRDRYVNGRSYYFFDADCMWNEGFRLSSAN